MSVRVVIQKKYPSSCVTGRLEKLEKEMQEMQAIKRDKELIFLHSQIYTRLLSVLQDKLFRQLPSNLQNELRHAGITNLPQIFVVWWNAWNNLQPCDFPLPVTMLRHIIDPILLPLYNNLLFNHHGGESGIGVTVRKAWEALDEEDRDLMVYCWCSKKDYSVVRNSHPDTTRSQAEQVVGKDLKNELAYLHLCAMKYISAAPEAFKVT